MKILVTGANGFVGRNLISTLENIRDGKDRTTDVPTDIEILKYDVDKSLEDLEKYCSECDFVYNLVGVHRPKDNSEFMKGNFGFASDLLNLLKKHNNKCPVMISSSIQAELDNPYGESKRAGENLMFDYSKETGATVFVYRFPNLFGKWSKPNYNSVVSTFCYNIANGLPIKISSRENKITLIYIDDVVKELLSALSGKVHRNGDFCTIEKEYDETLGEIADLIYSFKESRKNLSVPNMTEESFSKKLYSTYLSYLPTDEFSYPLKMNVDERGSFTEILKSAKYGQMSVNISKPHIIKGQHWHHTKNEKFLVVSGKGVIRFRRIDSDEIIEYFVSGDKLEVVDIPTGYTHNIENIGDTDMVTFMWCNECFNSEKPDTYFLPVSNAQVKTDDKKKVLVLGGSGMAGHVIACYLRECNYNVTVFDRTPLAGFNCIVESAFDTENLNRILVSNNYYAVINCIGLLNKACDNDIMSAAFLNGYLPHFIENALINSYTKVVHISSDCVFSNNDVPYIESDIPDATDNYGRTKVLGEINNEKDITFRTSIIGPDISQSKNGLINWFMKQKGSINGYSNVIWSGVTTVVLAKAIEKALNDNVSGIYHLVNNSYISKYELLKLFNKYFKKDDLVAIKNDDSVYQKKTLKNTRVDFDFNIPSYDKMLEETAEWINAHKDLYGHYWK